MKSGWSAREEMTKKTTGNGGDSLREAAVDDRGAGHLQKDCETGDFVPGGTEHSPNGSVSTEEKLEYRRRFLERAIGLDLVISMMEDLPGVLFFGKDLESRYVIASRKLALRMGVKFPQEILLARDSDLQPPAIAEERVARDRKVIHSRRPLPHQRELFFDFCEGLGWAITSRWPVFGLNGEVIGVVGSMCSFQGAPDIGGENGGDRGRGKTGLDRVRQYICQNKDQVLTSAGMAKAAGLSERQMSRVLHEHCGLSPRNFAALVRIQLACRSLAESDTPLIDVAFDHGFANQSSFTTRFRKFTGTTPRQFRLRWRKGATEDPPDGGRF
jgi:AraC-like DNA-binding protein